jgi:hypothetical protein
MLQHVETEKAAIGTVTDPADTLNEQRAYRAELLCNHYRQAFLHMLKEDFTDLDSTLRRMLEVLSTTLDVDRVSLWSFENNNSAIRCNMEFSRRAIGEAHPALLLKGDFPHYFAAIAQQLVIAADNAGSDLRIWGRLASSRCSMCQYERLAVTLEFFVTNRFPASVSGRKKIKTLHPAWRRKWRSLTNAITPNARKTI